MSRELNVKIMGVKKVPVDARNNSTALGSDHGAAVDLTINSGDTVTISCNAFETWRLAVGSKDELSVNANGLKNHFTPIKDGQVFRTGSMVGSFDNGNTFFSVGTCLKYNALEKNPANITLWCADSDNYNNHGIIVATVTVDSATEE